jgi:hypothetical protein
MKINFQLSTLILALLLVGAAFNAPAQTVAITNAIPNNPLNAAETSLVQNLWDDYVLSTNAAFVLSYGVQAKDTGTRIFAASYVYNFNNVAGLILGYDYISGSQKGQTVANAVRGGLSFKAPFAPLKSFGITNITVTPWVAELVSTVVSGDNAQQGSAGLVSCVGVDMTFAKWSWGQFHGGAFYENRTAQGWASGNYYLADLAITINRLPKF